MRFSRSLVLWLALLTLSCSTVPMTGRRQLSLIPASSMISMSFNEYDRFIKSSELSKDKNQTATVKRVGERIQLSTETYFAQQNMTGELNGYQWEFNLVENPQPNAWCMPGGKVVVYTGILEYTKDEAGLAVVIGHEVAHAIARHGNERMSQTLLTQMGGIALSEALREKPEETRALWLGAFGLGTQLGVLLPFSRLHESEADRLGLIFMAMAGYNPEAAISFWERMSASGGGAPPEFLSTHPSHDTRISDIRRLLGEAMPYYRQARK